MVKKNKIKKSVTLDGLMTLGQLDDGRHTADFACCEDVQLEQIKGTFSVQIQRDGNVYMTENKKRIRNSPIFREDNSSFSHRKGVRRKGVNDKLNLFCGRRETLSPHFYPR